MFLRVTKLRGVLICSVSILLVIMLMVAFSTSTLNGNHLPQIQPSGAVSLKRQLSTDEDSDSGRGIGGQLATPVTQNLREPNLKVMYENMERGQELKKEEEKGIGGGMPEKQDVNEREDVDSEESREEERVVGQIETCLRATNMSRYLEEEDYLFVARGNGRHMIRTLRTLIPRTFSSDYLSPCWEADFTMSIGTENTALSHLYDGNVSVQVNHTAFSLKLKDYTPQSRGYFLHLMKGRTTLSAELACLPKVFLAGFPKSGSTFLYCLMTRQFGVSQAEKEPHWWITRGPVRHPRKPEARHIPLYIFNFLNASLELESGHYQSKYQQPLTIDGSPNVMFDWPRWHLDEPPINYCLLPAVIPEVLPDSKYVVVMRNPVDMLYSAFWFSCTTLGISVPEHVKLRGPDIFHERITAKIDRFYDCRRTHSLHRCVVNISYNLFSPELPKCGRSRLELGLYFVHIEKWLSVVPREKFLFMTLEEMSRESNGVEQALWSFLDFPSANELFPYSNRSSKCWTNSQQSINYRDNPQLQMRQDTQELLRNFFKPFNQMLVDLLGDQKYLWN